MGQCRDGQWGYALPGGLSSVRQMTDAHGQVARRYDYDPLGQVVAARGIRPSALQYTGEQADAGLVYLRAGWNNAATGRFLTRDPFSGFAALPQTQRSYMYVASNPVDLTDPSRQLTPRTHKNPLVGGGAPPYLPSAARITAATFWAPVRPPDYPDSLHSLHICDTIANMQARDRRVGHA